MNVPWFSLCLATFLLPLATAACDVQLENGTSIGSSGSTMIQISVPERTPANSVLFKLIAFEDATISCYVQPCNYTDVRSSAANQFEVYLKRSFGDEYDNGLTDVAQSIFSYSCPSSPTPTVFVVIAVIEGENSYAPEFNKASLQVTLEESMPLSLDFISPFDLSVTDKDRTNRSIIFTVDSSDFQVLPPAESRDCNTRKPIYYPRIGLAKKLTAGSYSFQLTATDGDVPSKSSSVTVTVTVNPSDLRDPTFEHLYYTATISDPSFASQIPLDQGKILAADGDTAMNKALRYTIVSTSGSASISLANDATGGVQLNLDSPLDPAELDKKVLVVVVQAAQEDDPNRKATVSVVIVLPAVLPTTTVGTTTACPTETPVTCEPCTCPTLPAVTTSEPCTCPTTVTATSATECPVSTCEPCTCPTATITTSSAATECPVSTCEPCACPTTTAATATTITAATCEPCTLPTLTPPNCPVVTCPSCTMTCPTFESTTYPGSCPPCPTSSTGPITTPSDTATTSTTTQGNTTTTIGDHTCPVVTCPTTTTSTETCPTCPDCTSTTTSTVSQGTTSMSSTTTDTTYCTPCPTTLPATCDPTSTTTTTTTTTATVTTPTTTIGSTTSTTTTTEGPATDKVEFAKDRYSAEIVEMTPNVQVVTVQATAMSGANIIYSLDLDPDNNFRIDPSSGTIYVSANAWLYAGKQYDFQAVAKVASGASARTDVSVLVVPHYTSCSNVKFSNPVYEIDIAEKSTNLTVVQLGLDNADGTETAEIVSVQPSSLFGKFYVDGFIVKMNQSLDRSLTSGVIITVILTENKDVTTLVRITVLDVNEPPEFAASTPGVIGYPRRTFFDSSVDMAIHTFHVIDPDSGENAKVTFSLIGSPAGFFIDPHSGALYAEDLVLCTEKGCTVQVQAVDGGGLSATKSVTVRLLSDELITVLKIDAFTNTTLEDIMQELSKILGYSVYALGRQSGQSTQKAVQRVSYAASVYAVKAGNFVSRDVLKGDIEGKSFDTVWTLDKTSITGPPSYEPEILQESNNSLTIAAGSLGGILGLVLIAAAVYVLLQHRNKRKVSSNSVKNPARKDSLEYVHRTRSADWTAEKKSNSNETEATTSNGANYLGVDNNGFERKESNSSFRIQFKEERVYIDEELEKRKKDNLVKEDEDIYNPESPKPTRSILKGSNEDLEDLGKRRTGVTFNPTPEVLQVAPTLPEPEEIISVTDGSNLEIAEL